MRSACCAAFLITLFSIGAAAAPQPLQTRSAQHELTVLRTPLSQEQVEYDLTVTDLQSGSLMLRKDLTAAAGQPVEAEATVGADSVRVRLAYTEHFFTATMSVTRDGKVVDNFRTWWELAPGSAPEAIAPGLNAPGAYRVGGEIKAPRVIRRVEPIYPEEARRAHAGGTVVVEVLIGADGRVKDAAVLKEPGHGLGDSVVSAVLQWEFEPATLKGKPVDVIFNLTSSFKIATPPPPPAP